MTIIQCARFQLWCILPGQHEISVESTLSYDIHGIFNPDCRPSRENDSDSITRALDAVGISVSLSMTAISVRLPHCA